MISEKVSLAADPNAREARAQISKAELEEAVRLELERLQESVTNLRLLYLVQGLKAGDPFVAMVKDNLYNRDAAHIAPRVRMDQRFNTPSFYWERTIRRIHDASKAKKAKSTKTRQYNAYYSKKGDSTSKKEVTVTLVSEHIPVNKRTLVTSASHFEKEPAWAQAAFSVVEPELVTLRRKSKLLSSINRLFLQLAKV